MVTTTQAVRELLQTGIPYTTIEVQRFVKYRTGKMRSESGISARIRQLRKEFVIQSRPRKGSSSYEYRIDA